MLAERNGGVSLLVLVLVLVLVLALVLVLVLGLVLVLVLALVPCSSVGAYLSENLFRLMIHFGFDAHWRAGWRDERSSPRLDSRPRMDTRHRRLEC